MKLWGSNYRTNRGETPKDQETDEDDTTERERAHNQDTKIFIAALKLYFMQKSNEGSHISAPESCAEFVQLQSIKRTLYVTLDQFLRY